MPSIAALSGVLIQAALVLLGAVALIGWLRDRRPSRGYIALAMAGLALLALSALIPTPTTGAAAFVKFGLDVLFFLTSGYALVLYQGTIVRLNPLFAVLTLAGMLGVAAVALYEAAYQPDGVKVAGFAVVGVWMACIAEPVIVFWFQSGSRPAVQKARLRTLALGYLGLALLLIIALGAGASSNPGLQVASIVMSWIVVPLLYASLYPPAFLRRMWRNAELAAYVRAIRDLVLFSPDRKTLASRATEWAIRLTGADGAAVVDADGSLLAVESMDEETAKSLFRRKRPRVEGDIHLVPGVHPRRAIVVGLQLREGMGALIALAGAYTPFFDKDEVLDLSLYATDVVSGLDRAGLTEHIRALEQTKTEFLNLASHELRGPLTVIRGYLDMIAAGSMGAVPRKLQPVLPMLSGKAAEMDRLVDQMIEASRLEQGRLELHRSLQDLRRLAESAIESMRPMADGEHELRLDNPDFEILVDVDGERIQTILTNLISNAIKYSPGGGQVQCKVLRDNEWAKVIVKDAGVGISQQDAARLFTRFGRIATESTKNIPGTGLGLYLSRELALLHEGDLTVESEPGEGSTFTLAIPTGKAATAQ